MNKKLVNDIMYIIEHEEALAVRLKDCKIIYASAIRFSHDFLNIYLYRSGIIEKLVPLSQIEEVY